MGKKKKSRSTRGPASPRSSRSKKRRSRKRSKFQGFRPTLRRAAAFTAQVATVVLLPFILLVGGSVFSHRFLNTHGWISVLLGGTLATLCVAAWGTRIWRHLTGRNRFRVISQRIALPLVLGFGIYCVGWVSSFNAKSPQIQNLYQDLHPALRLAIGTASLTDPDVLITEISRKSSDYQKMGLNPVKNSLHFEQPDGWVHAVDLRTLGRSEIRNQFSELFYRALGFRVLRHTGTGDHLHIALPRPQPRSQNPS